MPEKQLELSKRNAFFKDPFFQDLRSGLDDGLEKRLAEFSARSLGLSGAGLGEAAHNIQVSASNEKFMIQLELPGFSPEDFSLKTKDDMMSKMMSKMGGMDMGSSSMSSNAMSSKSSFSSSSSSSFSSSSSSSSSMMSSEMGGGMPPMRGMQMPQMGGFDMPGLSFREMPDMPLPAGGAGPQSQPEYTVTSPPMSPPPEMNHKVQKTEDYVPPSNSQTAEATVLLKVKEGDEYKLALNMQQYSPEDITIKLNGQELTIEAASHGEKFSQKHIIPDNINLDAMSSSFSSDGVLVVKAPKK